MFLFDAYHQNSKNKLERPPATSHPDTWPEDWKTTYIKTYPRFEVIKLPEPKSMDKNFSEIVVSRRSGQIFDKNISLENLSELLYFSVGEIKGKDVRVYPSAGARYPLEFYILVFKDIEGLTPGIYHYNITVHGLTVLKKRSFEKYELSKIDIYGGAKTAVFLVIFTGIFDRLSTKYGERSYRYLMLEAGGVMQNFALCAQALGMTSLSMGGVIDDYVEDLIGVDGGQESIVHGMFFG
jgi:SagB-type dehydrogenase family enzyme